MPAKKPSKEESAKRAKTALQSKPKKTALEDALASANGDRTVQLVQWARLQWETYRSDLTQWRENRRKYAQEAQDLFAHRVTENTDTNGEPKLVFQISNDSLNLVASLAEFASAQASQDLFGGEPWFAATPVGKTDTALADTVQKHLQWSFRDQRLVSQYESAVTRAACLGEVFTKTTYDIDTDHYEETIVALHVDGEPVMVDDKYITTDEQALALKQAGKVKGKADWKPIYIQRNVVLSHGVDTCILHPHDVAFREDAPELDLRYTNFYHLVEMSVLEAITKFNLSLDDASRLAQAANTQQTSSTPQPAPANADNQFMPRNDSQREVYGDEEKERLMNMRVRLVEGWVRVDPFGDGQAKRLYIVFPPQSEDWLVYADYLGNLSPKSELPVKVHVWEEVPGKLYGRGFFAKYASVQSKVDDLWNQISYRNRMHANPVGAFDPTKLERDDDDADLELRPGEMLRLKPGERLEDALTFVEFPDLDQRSMDLLQIAMQLAQTRSGITSASQGDLSSVPENNTATGIRQLMSRAAVLMKKPVRGLRRSMGREFSYAVKLLYANFDRDEAFVWGEGETPELFQITADQVRNLDIDVRMLLTQEQNQTKLEGAQVATGLVQQYLATPEGEKPAVRPLFTQALKALEFDQSEEIIRQPNASIEDTLLMLPPDQQQRLQGLLAMEQAAQAMPTTPAAPQAAPTTPNQNTTQAA